MELERTLAKMYRKFTEDVGLTPALSRKLTGMARDRILKYGTENWLETYGRAEEGLSKFVHEAATILLATPDQQHYVRDDPFVRPFIQANPPPKRRTPPTSRPRATSSPALLRPLPSLLAPEPVPEPVPAPAPKKKAKKQKAKKQTAPAVDPDVAFLEAEIARNEAEASQQEASQADELARLRAEALAGDAAAQATLERLYDVVSRAREQTRKGRR